MKQRRDEQTIHTSQGIDEQNVILTHKCSVVHAHNKKKKKKEKRKTRIFMVNYLLQEEGNCQLLSGRS